MALCNLIIACERHQVFNEDQAYMNSNCQHNNLYRPQQVETSIAKFGKVFGSITLKHLMNKICLLITAFLIIITINSCSKKNHPSGTTATKSADSTAATKIVKKRPLITTVPKVITVNDKVAKRSVDGRYYYDLNGHRYWRNNKDGKYYLFNKSMFDDDAFKVKGN